jgi:hypothetical protein
VELFTGIQRSPGHRRSRPGACVADQPRRVLSRAGKIVVPALIYLLISLTIIAAGRIEFSDGDIVAFVGGGDVAAAQQTGHLESLLSVAHPAVRWRNFGWEGDTVFAQPRDYNFPALPEHLRKAGVTRIFVQFGRMESFAGGKQDFRAAYEKLVDTFARITPRLVLVTPVPFERPPAPLPDLTQRNSDLERLCAVIHEIGKARQLPVIDLFAALKNQQLHLTEDGLQLTPKGHAVVALAFAKELGLISRSTKLSDSGAWQDRQLEALRQVIIAKNRLWFDYWRPQNWAFLGGDRIEQPSSRDHRDPKIRWFPEEMRKFEPLIAEKEKEIETLARSTHL